MSRPVATSLALSAAAAVATLAALGCGDQRRAAANDAGAPAERDRPPPPAVPTPVEAARAAFDRGCERGDAQACLAAKKPDDACVHGNGRGCLEIAERGGALRETYLARACRRGVERACAALPARPESPIVLGSGIGAYRAAVIDCWAETDGVDRERELRGTVALTTDLDGKTTAVARFDNRAFARCIERSASRWVVDDNRDVDLNIRPANQRYGIATLDGFHGGVIGGVQGGVLGGGGLGGSGLGSLSGGGGFGSLSNTLGPPRPRVTATVLPLDDTIERGALRRKVMSRYLGGVRRCARQALEDDDKLITSIRLRFTVTPTGAVDNISAQSTGPDALRKCVKDLAKNWSFERPIDDAGRPATGRVAVSIYISGR